MTTINQARLLQRWVDLLPEAHLDRAIHAFFMLRNRYGELGRDYHGLPHIVRMLDACDHYFPGDAIHDGLSPRDELRSGFYMEGLLTWLGVPQPAAEIVNKLIITTATHQANTRLGQQLDDLDLLSLGTPPHVYQENTAKIRAEYQIPDEHWRLGRLAFIERFLNRAYIYQTPEIYALFETQARTNLRAERESLLLV
jgi:predicted metal-dependent HD superfamily phosphohydrolase